MGKPQVSSVDAQELMLGSTALGETVAGVSLARAEAEWWQVREERAREAEDEAEGEVEVSALIKKTDA